MKKFYYKKEESIDKTPIILRLDRRHMPNVNKDGQKEEQSRYAARATSISSLEQLKDVPTLPRGETREVAKSMSDAVLSKSYSTASTVVITEAELSSSWLYKNMKAAVNSKENECEITSASQSSDLSPVTLQDPKMKPVPVPSKRRSKTFSCRCYLAIVIIIAICSIGFLSTIGGIIYIEVISKYAAVDQTTEAPVDNSSLLHEAQSQQAGDSAKPNDHESNMNEDSSRSFDSGNINENTASDDPPKTIHILDFGKTLGAELSQYIDNKRTQIRFQEGNSAIYEEKSINRVEYKESSNVHQSDTKIGNNGSTEINSNQSRKILTQDGKLESIDQSQNLISRESNVAEANIDHLKEFSSLNALDNLKENKMATESTSEAIAVSIESNELDSSIDHEKLNKYVNAEISDGFLNVDNVQMDQEKTAGAEIYLNERVPQKSMTELQEVNDPPPSEDIYSINSDQRKKSTEISNLGSNSNKSNTDVESMLSVIDEPILDNEKSLILNTKGNANLFINFPNFRTTTKPEIMTTNFQQRFGEQEKPKDVGSKSPLDIKVSMAEAIKHLQVLDVNNKLPSSRTKSSKPKIKVTTQQPRTNRPPKEEVSQEKIEYLQKLRRLFYEQLK